mmetsp:Transcript_40766/g.66105  ORF Transcript_40766/g.66105 Transcript_40766/m.66105 type:complete len:155 (-) Transcript_40766:46-510(-)
MSTGAEETAEPAPWFKPSMDDHYRPHGKHVPSPKGDNDFYNTDTISLQSRESKPESPKDDHHPKQHRKEGASKITGECVLDVPPKYINPITGEARDEPSEDHHKKKMGLWDDSRDPHDPISKLPTSSSFKETHRLAGLDFSVHEKVNPITGEPV